MTTDASQSPTFRDFAAAIMQSDAAAAARVLEVLLELDASGAARATAHFQERMAAEGQAFMAKAMSLRTAVTSGDDTQTAQLLADVFGLDAAASAAAAAAVRRRFAPA